MTPGERAGRLLLGPLLLAAWEVLGRLGGIETRWVSLPSVIVARTVKDLLTGGLVAHAGVTLGEMAAGFVAGALTGIACGLLFARFRLLRLTFLPYLNAVYTIPRPALAPLFVLWFGVGFVSKLALVVTLVYFVFLLHVTTGLQTIDQRHVAWLRTLGATRGQVLARVGLPHLLPWLFAAAKLGLALALIGAIVGELISSQAGLGFLMMRAAENVDRVGVLSGILLLSVIVMAIVAPMAALERRLFRWRLDPRL